MLKLKRRIWPSDAPFYHHSYWVHRLPMRSYGGGWRMDRRRSRQRVRRILGVYPEELGFVGKWW